MAPDTRGFAGLLVNTRNSSHSKWNILFEKNAKEWIAFKPALGLHVYPCYSCRHMFYSKKSFLDHVNRRAVLLRYKCSGCANDDLTFYNRCSFLLHCRKHYSLEKGLINLNNLEISSLPLGLAGFFRHSDIPYLFDVEEDLIIGDTFMNAQFYSPKIDEKGKETISLTPSHLVINRTNQNGENQALALKQIARNIPKCQFISLQALKELSAHVQVANDGGNPHVEIKNELEESQTEQITFSEEPVTSQRNDQFQNRSINTSAQQNPTTTQVILSDGPGISTASDVDVDDLLLQVITKIETVDEPLGHSSNNRKESFCVEASSPPPLNSFLHKCTECHAQFSEPLSGHFLGSNRPISERFRCLHCKLICPTLCSFQAHARIHEKQPPYVCPDCGIEFPDLGLILTHMNKVCFHLAKSVRFRCPGRRCGKIFASDATFGPHFKQVHIDTLYLCSFCKKVFPLLDDCRNHCLTHPDDIADMVKLFSCSCCGEDDMNWRKLEQHLDYHCKDLSRCIYIFMCKFCKCYFRSVQTMATHLQNCKVQKTGIPRRMRPTKARNLIQSKYLSGQCKLCNNKLICLKSKPSLYCTKCLNSPPKSPVPAVKKAPVLPSEKCVCILCKSQIDYEERRRHQQECKYAKPQVVVERLERMEKMVESMIHLNQSFSSSNSDFDGSHDGSPRPRKRHRPYKPKKPEVENDLTAEEPILFDGTYQCRLCDYKSTERVIFHEHIKVHRHISTAYQCMECGECFVVKPSLVKHLLHFHNTSNYEQYFLENDCFDHGAVSALAKVVKAPYLANNVKENQCKVCMEQFEDSESHDKHFRTHGMAFLMKNTI